MAYIQPSGRAQRLGARAEEARQALEGGITALVGPSRSGKSTVARLIASFWEASGGTVSIGGVDVRTMPLDQVMDTVSYVTQDN